MYASVDYEYVHSELKKPGVTLKLLWQEHKDDPKDGVPVGYTKFCDDYAKYVEQSFPQVRMRITSLSNSRRTNLHLQGSCAAPPITEVTTMLNEETRRELREMNFGELVDALDLQEKQAEYLSLPFDDRINLAVDYAYSAKFNAKVHRLIKAAKLHIADAVLSNIHYENRGLDKDLLLTLGTCGFIPNNQPVVINGFTGSGKSYLACAIGRHACMQGFRSRYIRVPDLMELLSEATLTTSGRSKLLKKFSGYRLLILDEWLLNDLTELEQHFFF